MTFDAGTWWLITIIVTTVVGLVGFLFGRSVFRQLDENRADIKQVRENYTPRDDHQKDLERLRTAHQKDVEALRREMKEMRTEMRTEIRQMSDDVKDIKENCIRRGIIFFQLIHQVPDLLLLPLAQPARQCLVLPCPLFLRCGRGGAAPP